MRDEARADVASNMCRIGGTGVRAGRAVCQADDATVRLDSLDGSNLLVKPPKVRRMREVVLFGRPMPNAVEIVEAEADMMSLLRQDAREPHAA